MITLRPFASLGTADHGWLKAHFHFSFANYFDPDRMGHGALRVWNDDEIAPQSGFPPHPHADMEIITFVRDGVISHQDSLGNSGKTKAGDVQVMSAGTGVRHAEYNLEQGPTRLFQIWIMPTKDGGQPCWGTRPFPRAERSGRLIAVASGWETDADALPIRADARVLAGTLRAGDRTRYQLGALRHAYLVPASGRITINGVEVNARDGAAVSDEAELTITALDDSELVMVDVA